MRILVTAASRHGSTTEIATALAAALRDKGARVDVVAPEQVDAVDGYDAVVLGSAVYLGHWLHPAKSFVDRHAGALRERAVFLFSSGPIGDQDRPVNRPYDASHASERTGAREHRMFAGKLDPEVLGAGERVVARMTGGRTGDFRDWDAIGTWAAQIVESVERQAVESSGWGRDSDGY